jgi:hypothetical protein
MHIFYRLNKVYTKCQIWCCYEKINFAPSDKILDEKSSTKFCERKWTKFQQNFAKFLRNFAKVYEQNFDEIMHLFFISRNKKNGLSRQP